MLGRLRIHHHRHAAIFTEHVLSACDMANALILIATLDIPPSRTCVLHSRRLMPNPKDLGRAKRADAKVGLATMSRAIKSPIAVSIPNSLTCHPDQRGILIVLRPEPPVSAALKNLVMLVSARFEEAGEAEVMLGFRRSSDESRRSAGERPPSPDVFRGLHPGRPNPQLIRSTPSARVHQGLIESLGP